MTEKRQATAANEEVAEDRVEVQPAVQSKPDGEFETLSSTTHSEGSEGSVELPTLPNYDEIMKALEQAEANAQDFADKLLRAQADLDNMRRRNERELASAHRYALEGFTKELISVRDSLEMGLDAARSTVDIEKLREGVDLTLRMLTSVFEKFGVKEVNPVKQKFDPTYHQAMSVQESAEYNPNTVLAVFQKGYLLHDRLLRPALVQVSKAVAQPPADSQQP